ncbi:tRNA (guanine-N1)-methyltransferase [Poritiphilus flavus]|uniref:tRNA (Guanine-N1)-methyltransferase n=1 Tax=Poritiphilus flavus TaxID=2697053 RepID=A0A6L9EF07_9FLAO|nr:tRNA (guanine-N1)-methyltransferase [Poritiphilus flavus]NAS13354.1 tRNA (guanine-N1)-methyltransferase [Poritiphilus flavus]
MKGYKILSIIIALWTFNLQYAQDAGAQQELSLDQGSIDSQFEFIYKKSGNYRAEGKRYEVVRVINLDKLRKNVIDSINAANAKKSELNATIATHEATISSLNKKLEDTTSNLNSVTAEKDSMSFLGIQVSKGTYNGILWTIIAGLLALLLLFIYKFRRSNILTQIAKSNLSELETEYEDHRRRALEREQRISRQLQDEINKYKKMK